MISDSGGTLEAAVPEINAYLVGVEPENRAEVLASLQSSSAVANASNGTRTSEGAPRPNRNTFGVTRTPTGGPQLLGHLPLTGLGLLLFVMLGLALLATGRTTRACTRPSV